MKQIAYLTLALALSGCIGTSDPSHFYALTGTDLQPAVSTSFTGRVGIEAVRVPAMLDRPQIVTRKASVVEVKLSETNRWAEPLSTQMQRQLARDMETLLPKATVKAKGFEQVVYDYTVNVDVVRFDGQFNQNVVLNAWWSISDKLGHIQKAGRVQRDAPVKETYTDLVAVQSDLIGQLARDIAKELGSLPSKK